MGGKADDRPGETVRSHPQERESGQLVAIVMALEKGDVTSLPVESVQTNSAAVSHGIGQDQAAGGVPIARMPVEGITAYQQDENRPLDTKPGRSHQRLWERRVNHVRSAVRALASGSAASRAAGAWIGNW